MYVHVLLSLYHNIKVCKLKGNTSNDYYYNLYEFEASNNHFT